MGNLHAMEIASMVGEKVDLRTALSWHLGTNHYPPAPSSMIDPCLEAIENAEFGDWDAEVTLPEGVLWRGEEYAPTWAIVDQHHLDAFIRFED